MCGIVAYYNKKGISNDDLQSALEALNAIKHRGPDGDGAVVINTNTGEYKLLQTEETPKDIKVDIAVSEYQSNSHNLFLGHRRLSIFDLSSNGFQPMKDEFGNWIIFNGEVYNFLEIRNDLQKKYSFRTKTDTEVILVAYREWGTECLQRFNGMWGMIIWDNKKKELFISNDRLGVKPLYYLQNVNEFIYSSEIKSILRFSGREGNLHRENIHTFLKFGLLDLDDSTFHENIFRFKKSSFRTISFRNERYKGKDYEYWKAPLVTDQIHDENYFINAYNELLEDAIKLRMRADVPWGVALSGGLDSSSIVYLSNKNLKKEVGQEKINTFSIIFPENEGDESEYSKFIEKDLNTNAQYANALDSFTFEDIEKQTYHLDYPLQSTSYCAEWTLMKLVSRSKVKVLIGGQGADELFGGYHHHFYKYCRELLLRGKPGEYLNQINKFASLKQVTTQHLHRIIFNDVKLFLKLKLKRSSLKDDIWDNVLSLQNVLKLDLTSLTLPSYLRTDDRDSMAFGLETRLPFLDYRMVEFAMKLPSKYKIKNGWNKYLMRESASYLHDRIRYRRDKKGFTTPERAWITKFKNEFAGYIDFLNNEGYNYSKDEILKDYNYTSENSNNTFRIFALGIWLKIIKQN